MRGVEREYITRVLAYMGGSKEETAKVLKVSLATLYRKLPEFDTWKVSLDVQSALGRLVKIVKIGIPSALGGYVFDGNDFNEMRSIILTVSTT